MARKTNIKKPEIMAPAGNWESLVSAVKAGADSVYFGLDVLNMRITAENFRADSVKDVVDYAHGHGVKAYLALNTIVFEDEIGVVKRVVAAAKKAGVDAVICWDMAVFSECRKHGIDIFLSTQASVSNAAGCEFYRKLGAKRITLARECSLDQIREIKKKTKAEIEVFVHGAMCVSVSGRCFLSQDVFGKSANRGDCLQPCRREYVITDAEEGHSFVIGKDYVLSPKDLCAMPFIEKVIESGVDAFKIEGRARSPEYAFEVVSAYRKAVDLWHEGKLDVKAKRAFVKGLEGVYNRGFHSGFFLGRPADEWARCYGSKASYVKEFVGVVKNFYAKQRAAEVAVQSRKIMKGDTLMIIGPTTGTLKFKASSIQKNGKPVSCAEKGSSVGVLVKGQARKNDKVYVWKKRD